MRDRLKNRDAILVRAEQMHLKCPQCSYKMESGREVFLLIGSNDNSGIVSGEAIFCLNCPVILLEEEHFGHAAEHLEMEKYKIAGFVDLDAVPKDKQSIPFNDEDNPIPVIEFASFKGRSEINLVASKPRPKIQISRNAPCLCGSGKKYKKCCMGTPNDPALTIN